MKGSVAGRTFSALMVGALFAMPAGAQQSSQEDLKKELESIRETLRAIQKDVQDLKGMLAQQAPASGLNVVLELGSNPVRGDKSARLTLVEFSDYQ